MRGIEDIQDFYKTHTVEDYLEHHWPTSADQDQVCQQARAGLLETLQAMDALPRDRRFWANTNLQPTIYKVGKFVECRRAEDADDLFLAWAEVGLAILHCSTDFGAGALVTIFRAQPLDPLLVVSLAHRVLTESGADSSPGLRYFFAECNLFDRAEELLRRSRTELEPGTASWLQGLLDQWSTDR